MARRWVKIWVQECLVGTVRFDFTPAERGVWYDLLILAGNCRMEGTIAAGKGKPYPYEWIAGTLNVPLELLLLTLEKCKNSDRIEENGDGLRIINWQRYQSEYERQKPFRERKREEEQQSMGRPKVATDPDDFIPEPTDDVKATKRKMYERAKEIIKANGSRR